MYTYFFIIAFLKPWSHKLSYYLPYLSVVVATVAAAAAAADNDSDEQEEDGSDNEY